MKGIWLRDVVAEYIWTLPKGQRFTRQELIEVAQRVYQNKGRGQVRIGFAVSDQLYALKEQKKIRRISNGVYVSNGKWEAHGRPNPNGGPRERHQRPPEFAVVEPEPEPTEESESVEMSAVEIRYLNFRAGLNIPEIAEIEIHSLRRSEE